jgi:hypothetical protein
MEGPGRLAWILCVMGISTCVMACIRTTHPSHTPTQLARQFVAAPLDFEGVQVAASCPNKGEVTEEVKQVINREYLATLVELGPKSDMQVSRSPEPGSTVVSSRVTQIDPGCNPRLKTRVVIRGANGGEIDRFELSTHVISLPAILAGPAANRLGKALAEDLLERLKGGER